MGRKRIEAPGLFDLPPAKVAEVTVAVMAVGTVAVMAVGTLAVLAAAIPAEETAPEPMAFAEQSANLEALALDVAHYSRDGARFMRSIQPAWSAAVTLRPGERVTAFIPFGRSWYGTVIGKTPKGIPYVRYGVVDADGRPTAFDMVCCERGLSALSRGHESHDGGSMVGSGVHPRDGDASVGAAILDRR